MKPTHAQRLAIFSDARNTLVVAGPGSGKTFVAEQRIRRRIDEGFDPRRICVITYTNSAAQELQLRIGTIISKANPQMIEQEVELGFIGTLHAFCLRHLHEWCGLGTVGILDEDEADAELMATAKDVGAHKATKKALRDLRKRWFTDGEINGSRIESLVVRTYYRRLEAARLLDFDSILHRALQHLITAPGGQTEWDELIVDELQDASETDLRIYQSIAAHKRFYVGDQDQAIFQFRGGDPRLIKLLADSGKFETHILEGNFRSGQAICDFAQKLIEPAQERIQKGTVALTPLEATVSTGKAETSGDEALMILDKMATGQTATTAILTRTNRVAEELADVFEARGIKVARGNRELPGDWPMVKAVVLKVLAPDNNVILERYIRVRYRDDEAETMIRQAAMGLKDLRKLAGVTGFPPTIEAVRAELILLAISDASQQVLNALWKELPDPKTVETLALAVATYRGETNEVGDVYVGTIHSAKGREWDEVFVAGCEDEIMPANHNIDEERRLAYVAATRARSVLVFTRARRRPLPFGRKTFYTTTWSRFLTEAGLVK